MAMTKKERADFDAALLEARILGALRWTQKINRDVAPPALMKDGITKGFMYCGEFSGSPRVEVACSSSIYHSVGNNEKTTTQSSKHLFSTRELALRGLRNEMEMYFAKQLAHIDKLIYEATGADQ